MVAPIRDLGNKFSVTMKNMSSILTFKLLTVVRRGSYWSGSPQNGLGDEWTCGMTLASAYVLCHLSAVWSQLQMKERKSEWK